jgi:hypothetical protein
MPWWLYKEQLAGKLGFARGYHIEFGGGREMPGMDIFNPNENSYGRKFKDEVRRYFGATIEFAGRGEMIPNDDCFCELDPDRKDKWGIPVLRFHWKWSDHEKKQAVHMQQTFKNIIEALGGRTLKPVQLDPEKAIMAGGTNHSRSRHDLHRQRGEIVGAESVEPGLGGAESLHHGRRTIRQQRGQKPHALDHGAGDAFVQFSRGEMRKGNIG